MKKYSLLVFSMVVVFASCKSKAENDAIKTTTDVQATLKQYSPGEVPTSSQGYTMRAKINGKDWEAATMMPPEKPSRIIGSNNEDFISFPYDRRMMVVGDKTKFGEGMSPDMYMLDDMWGAKTGELEITKVTDDFAEGTFFFTASQSTSDKTVAVTDGFFRILFK